MPFSSHRRTDSIEIQKRSATNALPPRPLTKRSAGLSNWISSADTTRTIASNPCYRKVPLRDVPVASVACIVGAVESIGARIKRLRIAKDWSRPELGRLMAKAIDRKKPFTGELIRLYETGKNTPRGDARRALAIVFGREEVYIEFGSSTPKAEEPIATYEKEPSAREDMMLTLFRGLTREQQRELVIETMAMVDGNKEIQRRFLNKPLRTYSNEEVKAAFGKVPSAVKVRKKPAQKQDSPLDDSHDDE